METLDSDRNLLFGVLALQLDFIDRDQLVAGLNAWVLDKESPLGRVLMDQGALSPEHRAVLEPLVDAHLRGHGGDPRRSLASLGGAGAARSALAAVSDSDVRASLAFVGTGKSHGSATDDGHSGTWSAGTASSSGTRFRVLRPHAEGGLGAVYLALDEELHREVALKQILDDYADDPGSRQRFLVEAEITGGLEHPGIVPVYGLGSYEDGRPFYAMRFIKGDSLKDAIAAFHADASLKADPGPRTIELRKLLRRYLDVCNAVEYAHARGVLHRDLKPGNVIVGKYGETLVVDWGLAKTTGRDDPNSPSGEGILTPVSSGSGPETLPGHALGTPAYMSPEQAAGDLHRLGSASDVYSLGATLYQLLTGKAPFEGEITEVLGKVMRGEFARPRQLDPSIDQALEAVCLKAMALKPEDRYASCRTLADDIERWTADEPVSAWPEPFARRAARWLRRHRTAVTATVLTGLVLTGALAVGYWREWKHSQEKDGFISKLDESNQNLKRTNTALDAQRKRAQDRERLAVEAVKKYRDAIVSSPELRDSPDLEQLRRKLLGSPIEFYRQLRHDLQGSDESDPEVLADLASACNELASLMGQVGDARERIEVGKEALRYLERLVSLAPGNRKPRQDLAMAYNNLSIAQLDAGDYEASDRMFQEGIRRQQKLLDGDPASTDYVLDLAQSYSNSGVLVRRRGRLDESLTRLDRSVRLVTPVAEKQANIIPVQRLLAQAHINRGNTLLALGRQEDAMRSLKTAADTLERVLGLPSAFLRLAAAPETRVGMRRDLAACYLSMGQLLGNAGEASKSISIIGKAYETLRETARENRSNRDLQQLMSEIISSAAYQHVRLREFDEADGHYAEAILICRDLLRQFPDSPQCASDLGAVLNNQASSYTLQARWSDALGPAREAIQHQRRARELNPEDPKYRVFLRNHLTVISDVYVHLEEPDQAAAAAREWGELMPDAASDQFSVGRVLARCAGLARTGTKASGFASEAIEHLKRAVALGFRDPVRLSQEPAFDSLRHERPFEDLLMELRDGAMPNGPAAFATR